MKGQQIDFRTLLPFPKELDGSVHVDDGNLITCYRVLLTLHQLLSDAQSLQLPGTNRKLCQIMRNDMERALLTIRTIQEIQFLDTEEA
jgi:hypothetical protein